MWVVPIVSCLEKSVFVNLCFEKSAKLLQRFLLNIINCDIMTIQWQLLLMNFHCVIRLNMVDWKTVLWCRRVIFTCKGDILGHWDMEWCYRWDQLREPPSDTAKGITFISKVQLIVLVSVLLDLIWSRRFVCVSPAADSSISSSYGRPAFVSSCCIHPLEQLASWHSAIRLLYQFLPQTKEMLVLPVILRHFTVIIHISTSLSWTL